MHTDSLDFKNYLEERVGFHTFGMFVRSARTVMDLSQVEMAKFLGLSKSTLCDIEKGRQLVSPTLAAKIAKKCKRSVKVAIAASLQDQLRKANLKYTVSVA